MEAEGREPSGVQLSVDSNALTREWRVESGRARALRSRRANQPDGLRRAATTILASVS